MDRQCQYWQQIEQQWRQMQVIEPQIKAQYQPQKMVNDKKLIRPSERGFINNPRYSTIGALIFKNKAKVQCAGTAFMISKNIAITAAHNLYDQNFQQKNTGHKFYLNPYGTTSTYYQIQKFIYPPQYEKGRKLKYDFGLIKLGKLVNPHLNICSNSQYLKLTIPCQQCIMDKDTKLSVYGYPKYENNYRPGIIPNSIVLYQYGDQKEDTVIKYSKAQGKICYSMSTQSGHSGSPVVVSNKIIAIHAGNAHQERNFNMGRLITSDMLTTLKDWYTNETYELKIDKSQLFQIHQQQCHHSNKKEVEVVKQVQSKKQITSQNNQLKKQINPPMILKKPSINDSQKMVFYYPSIKTTRNPLIRNQAQFINLNQTQTTKNPQLKEQSLTKNQRRISITPIKFKYTNPNKTLNTQSSSKSIHSNSNKTSTKVMNNQTKIQAFLSQGNSLLNVGRFREAISKFKQCLLIQQHTQGKNCLESAVILRRIGNVYYYTKQYEKARQIYQKSIDIYQNKKIINDDYAKCLYNLGNVYFTLKIYILAKEYYYQALKVYDQTGNKEQIDNCSMKIRNCLKVNKQENLAHKRSLSSQSQKY